MGYGRIRRLQSPTKREVQHGHRLVASLIQDPEKRKEYERNFIKPVREIRRPVDKRPVGPTEHQLQKAVIDWWRLVHGNYGLPEFALFAIPNGGARDVITGSLLKAEGVRPGIVDLCLAAPRGSYHGWYGEMKTGSNKPSDEQLEVLNYLDGAGYKTGVYWDSASAIKAIEEYLA